MLTIKPPWLVTPFALWATEGRLGAGGWSLAAVTSFRFQVFLLRPLGYGGQAGVRIKGSRRKG
jgi:hypothetical protein